MSWVGINTRICRILQHFHQISIGHWRPLNLLPVAPGHDSRMQIILASQLIKQLIDTHTGRKLFEHTVDRVLDSCIRMLSQVPVVDDYVACRNSEMQFSA